MRAETRIGRFIVALLMSAAIASPSVADAACLTTACVAAEPPDARGGVGTVVADLMPEQAHDASILVDDVRCGLTGGADCPDVDATGTPSPSTEPERAPSRAPVAEATRRPRAPARSEEPINPVAQLPRVDRPHAIEPRIIVVPEVVPLIRERPAVTWSIVIGLIGAAFLLVVFGLVRRRRLSGEVAAPDPLAGTVAYRNLTASLLANISHELYTPLTPVRGYASLLRDQTLSADKVREVAEQMICASMRLERVIDTIVSLADAHSGVVDHNDAVHVDRIVRDAVADVVTDPRRVDVRIARRLAPIQANEHLLRAAIRALVDNAVKFSDEDRKVRVDVHGSDDPGRKLVTITVSDRGIGMTPEQLRTAFEAFRQVDSSTTRRFGGLGIGVALAERVARAHGGRLLASSRAGKGSAFSLEIPLVTAERPVAVTPWHAEQAV